MGIGVTVAGDRGLAWVCLAHSLAHWLGLTRGRRGKLEMMGLHRDSQEVRYTLVGGLEVPCTRGILRDVTPPEQAPCRAWKVGSGSSRHGPSAVASGGCAHLQDPPPACLGPAVGASL